MEPQGQEVSSAKSNSPQVMGRHGFRVNFPRHRGLRSSQLTIHYYRSAQAAPKAAVDAFVRQFKETYISHGGIIENKNPVISYASKSMEVDENLNTIYQAA